MGAGSERDVFNSDVRVAMIAPGQEKDGIKKYTDYLTEELDAEVDLERLSLSNTVDIFDVMKLSRESAKYDVVHIQYTPEWWGNIFGYFWGAQLIFFLLLARAKSVLTVHEYGFEHDNRYVQSIQRIKNRLIYSQTDQIIVHNQRGRDKIREISPHASINVIPHGVPDTKETNGKLDMEGKILLIFGFIRPDKDYEEVLDVLQELPDDYRLLIAGEARTPQDKQYEEKLRNKVDELQLGERVHFYGFVPENEIPKIFNTADLSILPYRSSSGSGVLAHSLAHEVPTLVSDIPLASEWYWTEVYQDLTPNRIEQVIESHEIIDNIRTTKSERKWNNVAKTTVSLYESI
jgi:glycosyltransferase involved in cell wall biosynthesis